MRPSLHPSGRCTLFPPAEPLRRAPAPTHSTGRVERHLLSNRCVIHLPYHMHRTSPICAAAAELR